MPNTVLFTSFTRSRYDYPDELPRFSVAVYQPKGFEYHKLPWADIRDKQGRWIRPREFRTEKDPLQVYVKALLHLYETRIPTIGQWLIAAPPRCLMCCWCPHEKAAQRQLRRWGSFVCHTAILGGFLKKHFDVVVQYDEDRAKMVKLGY